MDPITHFFLKRRIEKYHDIVDGEKKYIAGILPDKLDDRDLDAVGIFGLFEDYEPKYDDLKLPNLGIKDQGNKNICGWISTVTDRENTEKVKLSTAGIVKFGMKEGYITGDGFSQLRDNCKIATKYGIPEESLVPTDINLPWSELSKFDLTPEQIKNAYSHRAESYAQVTNKKSFLKFLDEGNYLHTGSQWYNEYNMRGGFSYPWIINKPGNVLVGGHAFEAAGYIKNYLNRGLHIRLQNSYGEGWGDKGYFYMPIDFAMQFLYSRWIMLDLHVDVARFLSDNAGKNVRGIGQKSVWRIESGMKFAYPDWLTFLAFDGVKEEIVPVDPNLLDAVERGVDMQLSLSKYWPIIKEMSAPDNYKKLLELTLTN